MAIEAENGCCASLYGKKVVPVLYCTILYNTVQARLSAHTGSCNSMANLREGGGGRVVFFIYSFSLVVNLLQKGKGTVPIYEPTLYNIQRKKEKKRSRCVGAKG